MIDTTQNNNVWIYAYNSRDYDVPNKMPVRSLLGHAGSSPKLFFNPAQSISLSSSLILRKLIGPSSAFDAVLPIDVSLV